MQQLGAGDGMSPTEFDLRAALRDGEGDGVDADQVISGGRRHRAQRRARMMSTAAVTVLVAAAGIGATVIWNHSGTNPSTTAGGSNGYVTSGNSEAQNDALGRGALSTAAPESSALAGAPTAKDPEQCPDSLPRYLLPGGGSPGQFDTKGPLFAKPVSSVIVCSYGTPAMALGPNPVSVPARLVLDGTQAARLVTSLEQADTTKGTKLCPTPSTTDERELAIIGVTANGKALDSVTANLSQPACDTVVTNGTALRYHWTPPPDLQSRLLALTPSDSTLSGSPPLVRPSGRNHGSPIQS
jgi:hypothetical protein